MEEGKEEEDVGSRRKRGRDKSHALSNLNKKRLKMHKSLAEQFGVTITSPPLFSFEQSRNAFSSYYAAQNYTAYHAFSLHMNIYIYFQRKKNKYI